MQSPASDTSEPPPIHSFRSHVEKRSLLEEIREVLAQSYLIFLLADLRLMSGTGRIRTKYETLVIDSDRYPRTTSQNLAGLVEPLEMQEDYEQRLAIVEGAQIPEIANNAPRRAASLVSLQRGLSPCQVMAILLIELKETFELAKKKKQMESKRQRRRRRRIQQQQRQMIHSRSSGGEGTNNERMSASSFDENDSDDDEDQDDQFIYYRTDPNQKRQAEDSMESLLRAYSRMVASDLKVEVPHIRKRRLSTYGARGASAAGATSGTGTLFSSASSVQSGQSGDEPVLYVSDRNLLRNAYTDGTSLNLESIHETVEEEENDDEDPNNTTNNNNDASIMSLSERHLLQENSASALSETTQQLLNASQMSEQIMFSDDTLLLGQSISEDDSQPLVSAASLEEGNASTTADNNNNTTVAPTVPAATPAATTTGPVLVPPVAATAAPPAEAATTTTSTSPSKQSKWIPFRRHSNDDNAGRFHMLGAVRPRRHSNEEGHSPQKKKQQAAAATTTTTTSPKNTVHPTGKVMGLGSIHEVHESEDSKDDEEHLMMMKAGIMPSSSFGDDAEGNPMVASNVHHIPGESTTMESSSFKGQDNEAGPLAASATPSKLSANKRIAAMRANFSASKRQELAEHLRQRRAVLKQQYAERRAQLGQEFQARRQVLRQEFAHRMEVMALPRSPNRDTMAEQEFQELTNALFETMSAAAAAEDAAAAKTSSSTGFGGDGLDAPAYATNSNHAFHTQQNVAANQNSMSTAASSLTTTTSDQTSTTFPNSNEVAVGGATGKNMVTSNSNAHPAPTTQSAATVKTKNKAKPSTSGPSSSVLRSSMGMNNTNATDREIMQVMKRAVESRQSDRLNFMGNLFKAGSVSQLMVESSARIIWMNDWYPLKDLTYAIAVDPPLKRVLVVFRGAITKTDWNTVVKYTFTSVTNPVVEDFPGKEKKIKVFSGLYKYLFRTRKDTGTTKYDEIANLAHKYGREMVGDDYNLVVTGHSLGGALSVFFSLHASTEPRFTASGPVKSFAFGTPYLGSHNFADTVRHQERRGLVQVIRIMNHNDAIPHLPFNFVVGKRGCRWRHVGIEVVLPPIPWFSFRRWCPRIAYNGAKEKNWLSSTIHGYRQNFLFHYPWSKPWSYKRMHTLFELQDRLMYGIETKQKGGQFDLFQKTVDDLYEILAETDYTTLTPRSHRQQSQTQTQQKRRGSI